MKQRFRSASGLVLGAFCAALAFSFVAQALAEDAKPDGTWTWTTPGRNGGPDRKMTLKLKTEGDKLTGKLGAPNREGQVTETEIKDAKMTGSDIAFTVVREFNGNKMTSKYSGKVSSDSIKGKMEFDRNGETQSRDWIAKRETQETKESTEKK